MKSLVEKRHRAALAAGVMAGMVPGYLTDWVRRDPDFASLRGHPESCGCSRARSSGRPGARWAMRG